MSSPPIIQPPLPIRVFNPSNVAIFTSVSVHALLLLVALPSLSNLSAQNSNSKSTVGVIQLNEAEKARLPDVTPPLPSNPDNSSTSLIDTPLSQLPPTASSLPPLSALPPLPSMPSYPALPPYPSSLPPLTENPSLPMTIAPNSYPLANLPRLQLPPNPPPNLPTNQPSDRPNLPFTNPSSNLTPEDIRRASQKAAEQRQREIEAQLPQQTAALPQGNDNIPNQSQAPTPLNEQSRRDLIARRLVMDNLRQEELLRYNSQNTTDEEAIGNDLAYQQQTGTILSKDKIVYLAATYPRDACLRKLEGTSIYGVSTNQPPVKLKSSGFPLFDQYAQQIVQGKSFASPTRVAVTFKFDPKVCPGLSLPPGNESSKPRLPEIPPKEARLAPPTPVNPETTIPKPSDTRLAPSPTPSPTEEATIKPPLPLKTPDAVIPTPISPEKPEKTTVLPPQPVPEAIAPSPAPAAPKKIEASPLGDAAPRKTPENESIPLNQN